MSKSDSAAHTERRWTFDSDWAHGFGFGIAWGPGKSLLLWVGPFWFEVEREETVTWP